MPENHAALEQPFLYAPVLLWEEIVLSDSVLDAGHGKTVAVRIRLGLGHSGPADPNPIQATQPKNLLRFERA